MDKVSGIGMSKKKKSRMDIIETIGEKFYFIQDKNFLIIDEFSSFLYFFLLIF